ncbi:MAG: hypothetical protein ACREC6_01970 [Hyphomicrobiaceae bacterium]
MSEPAWKSLFAAAQTARTANVVCMKWGTRYGPEWVDRLYGMVRRNTSWTIRFVCFTDDATGIRPEVECQALPEVRFDPRLGKYWPKLGLMREGLGGLHGMTLFLDLDLIVLDSLDPFFTYDGRFCIVREWKDRHLGYGNSSVVRYFIGLEGGVLDRFYATPPEVIVTTYASKEQNFLTKAVEEVTFWPEDWCVPFSLACLPRNRLVRFFATPRKPADGKILVFFGSITPQTALRGEHEPKKRVRQGFAFRPTRRRFRPAAWINDYWRE